MKSLSTPEEGRRLCVSSPDAVKEQGRQMYGGRLTCRLPLALACLTVAGGLLQATTAHALTQVFDFTWTDGHQAGWLAGRCTLTVPDNRPMQVPRTILVDSSVPPGTVLHSWGVNDFLPGFAFNCQPPSGRWLANNHPGLASGTFSIPRADREGMPSLFFVGIGNGYGYPTNIPGISLRLIDGQGNVIAGSGLSGHRIGTGGGIVSRNGGRYSMHPGGRLYFALRGELVKDHVVTGLRSGYINIDRPVLQWRQRGEPATIGDGLPVDFLSGNAIRVITPSCWLRTTDTSIYMGTWNSIDALTTGPSVQVPVNLRCAGRVVNARMYFEDARYAHNSSTQNLTLYNSSGDRVNGLEIELKYNGNNHVPLNNIDAVNIGSHGVPGISGSAFSESDSQAMFTANYVQSGPVRANGHNYAGPVTGKVNLRIDWD